MRYLALNGPSHHTMPSKESNRQVHALAQHTHRTDVTSPALNSGGRLQDKHCLTRRQYHNM